MKRAGKERTKGVRVRRVLTCAGEFLSFFVFFSLSSCYCISSLFFIEEEVNDDFTWRKEHFLGKNSKPFIFEKGVSVPFGEFVSIKIESSLLFFFLEIVFLTDFWKNRLCPRPCLGELILFFQTNKSQLCSRPWVLASW